MSRRLELVFVVVALGAAMAFSAAVGGAPEHVGTPARPAFVVGDAATPQAELPPTRLGPTDAQAPVQFTLGLEIDDTAVDRYLHSLWNPSSPDYQAYLTAAEFGSRFGLDWSSVERVVRWAEDGGLQAAALPQRTSIEVTGTAAAVNRLLGITLVDWRSADGIRFHRPDTDPQIPPHLSREIAAIVGLDTEPIHRPASRILAAGVPGDGLVRATVARAYEIEPLHAAGLNGDDLTIAIISFDTFTPSDVDAFDLASGFDSPPVEIVRLPGAADTPGAGTGEVALDIQVIRGIAPFARIVNYEGPQSTASTGPMIARIVADGEAQMVSISWGLCERYRMPETLEVVERELAAAAAAGLSVFVSSGDDGAFDCRRVRISEDPFDRDIGLSVDFPASSPNAIAVGGTFLSTREDGTYLDEAGWEDPLSGTGGGGGVSSLFAKPTWQVGPGVDNAFSTGMRQLPDVAGPADPTSGFVVRYTEPGQGLVSGQVGGTSAAAPFWAASMLLTQQLAQREGIDRLGSLNPTLYQIAAQAQPGTVFHDVIRGGNLLHQAGPGWDYSTGWGSPRVAPLARAIIDFLSR